MMVDNFGILERHLDTCVYHMCRIGRNRSRCCGPFLQLVAVLRVCRAVTFFYRLLNFVLGLEGFGEIGWV